MKSYACEPASLRATAVVLFILIAIGIWAASGYFFYNQIRTVSSPYANIHPTQVIMQYSQRA